MCDPSIGIFSPWFRLRPYVHCGVEEGNILGKHCVCELLEIMEANGSLEEVCYVILSRILPYHEPVVSKADVSFDFVFVWWVIDQFVPEFGAVLCHVFLVMELLHGSSYNLVVWFVVECEVLFLSSISKGWTMWSFGPFFRVQGTSQAVVVLRLLLLSIHVFPYLCTRMYSRMPSTVGGYLEWLEQVYELQGVPYSLVLLFYNGEKKDVNEFAKVVCWAIALRYGWALQEGLLRLLSQCISARLIFSAVSLCTFRSRYIFPHSFCFLFVCARNPCFVLSICLDSRSSSIILIMRCARCVRLGLFMASVYWIPESCLLPSEAVTLWAPKHKKKVQGICLIYYSNTIFKQ